MPRAFTPWPGKAWEKGDIPVGLKGPNGKAVASNGLRSKISYCHRQINPTLEDYVPGLRDRSKVFDGNASIKFVSSIVV